MRQDEIYKHLKDVAEKLNITIMEKNFRNVGISVKSGLCVIKGQTCFLMDKHKKIREKNEILARCILNYPIDDIYIIPAVREFLEKQLL